MQAIVKLARGQTGPVPPLNFKVTAQLLANGFQIGSVGQITNMHRFCCVHCAIQIGEWIFCAEKMIVSPDVSLGAFHKEMHYNFGSIGTVGAAQAEQKLINFLTDQVLPILHPDLDKPLITIQA